jgi:hypothetical protein
MLPRRIICSAQICSLQLACLEAQHLCAYVKFSHYISHSCLCAQSFAKASQSGLHRRAGLRRSHRAANSVSIGRNANTCKWGIFYYFYFWSRAAIKCGRCARTQTRKSWRRPGACVWAGSEVLPSCACRYIDHAPLLTSLHHRLFHTTLPSLKIM